MEQNEKYDYEVIELLNSLVEVNNTYKRRIQSEEENEIEVKRQLEIRQLKTNIQRKIGIIVSIGMIILFYMLVMDIQYYYRFHSI